MTTPTTPEPFSYYNVGIEYHTKDKIIFHKEPTRNLEARWWGPDTPLSSAPDIEALTKERDEYKERMQRLMTTVTELTKERDSIAACYEAREEEAHQLSERIIKLTKERDALAAAGKRAVVALESLFGIPAEFTCVGGGGVAVWRLGGSDAPRRAITALREAGVR